MNIKESRLSSKIIWGVSFSWVLLLMLVSGMDLALGAVCLLTLVCVAWSIRYVFNNVGRDTGRSAFLWLILSLLNVFCAAVLLYHLNNKAEYTPRTEEDKKANTDLWSQL